MHIVSDEYEAHYTLKRILETEREGPRIVANVMFGCQGPAARQNKPAEKEARRAISDVP